jgi:hypothetical protein
MVEVVLGLFLIIGTGVMAHYYAPPEPLPLSASVRPAFTNEHQEELNQLTRDVDELKQEQAMPALVLNRYRNSICYIYGVYHVSIPGHRPALRARISGTGFVVAEGLLATNRHVAEPWYGDAESDILISKGAKPELEKLVAFFPGFPLPVDITPLVLSAHGDLAVDRFAPSAGRVPFPAESRIRENGAVGYPHGVLGMVAKSPSAVYERLAYRHTTIGAANELAALSLIRPSATCGHLGSGRRKLIYDASRHK